MRSISPSPCPCACACPALIPPPARTAGASQADTLENSPRRVEGDEGCFALDGAVERLCSQVLARLYVLEAGIDCRDARGRDDQERGGESHLAWGGQEARVSSNGLSAGADCRCTHRWLRGCSGYGVGAGRRGQGRKISVLRAPTRCDVVSQGGKQGWRTTTPTTTAGRAGRACASYLRCGCALHSSDDPSACCLLPVTCCIFQRLAGPPAEIQCCDHFALTHPHFPNRKHASRSSGESGKGKSKSESICFCFFVELSCSHGHVACSGKGKRCEPLLLTHRYCSACGLG